MMLRTGVILSLVLFSVLACAAGLADLYGMPIYKIAMGLGCGILATIYGYLTAPPRRL